MAFHLHSHAALDREIMRVVRQQIAEAAQAAAGRHHSCAQRIHRARASCKKVRATLRLVRRQSPRPCARENAWFRDSARRLARFRDADVMLAGLQDLLLKHASNRADRIFFEAIRRRLLAQRRAERSGVSGLQHELDRFVLRMRAADRRLAREKLDGVDFAVVADGFAATYRRARQAARSGGPRDAAWFHLWRKRVKAHGYQCRLLGDLWPAMMKTLGREVSTLGDLLGDEHDLSLLRDYLRDTANALGHEASAAAGIRLIETRRAELRRAALALGRRLFADKPRVVERRLLQWWKASGGALGRKQVRNVALAR